MIIQTNNNNVNFLIDLTFTKFKRLFVLSFERISVENNEILYQFIIYQIVK